MLIKGHPAPLRHCSQAGALMGAPVVMKGFIVVAVVRKARRAQAERKQGCDVVLDTPVAACCMRTFLLAICRHGGQGHHTVFMAQTVVRRVDTANDAGWQNAPDHNLGPPPASSSAAASHRRHDDGPCMTEARVQVLLPTFSFGPSGWVSCWLVSGPEAAVFVCCVLLVLLKQAPAPLPIGLIKSFTEVALQTNDCQKKYVGTFWHPSYSFVIHLFPAFWSPGVQTCPE